MDDDLRLLEAWQGGDEQAGRALVERHYDAIERFFVNKTTGVVAIDLIQSTFLKLVESRERIDGSRAFRPYLFGIARNVLYMYFRADRRDAQTLDFDEQSLLDLTPSMSRVLAKEHEVRLLYQALCRIPLELQIVIEMTYWEGMLGRELAELLDVPLGTARTRLRRAKRELERELERLAQSPAVLASTVSNLEDWARRLRDQAPKAAG